MNQLVYRLVVALSIFLLGCLAGSYAEVQWRGLDGRTIEQCAQAIRILETGE